MDKTDFLIIGAGVIGLAIAAELADRFHNQSVILLEQHHKFGQETSSRNSEVIHAGIYYPKASLKAILCVEGKHLLYDFCSKWKVPHEPSGKLIVANTPEEVSTLEELLIRGKENGVKDLQFLDSSQISRYEPNIKAEAAIYSPSTGIIDSHKLMERLEWLAVSKKTIIACGHKVTSIEFMGNQYAVSYQGPQGTYDSINSSWVINSSGLSSDYIASLPGIDIDTAGYRLFPCKGEYFSIPVSRAKLVSRLIYPPPYKDLRGLGIHFTKKLDGSAKLGPNAFYVDAPDYTVTAEHASQFYNSLKEYLPFLNAKDLCPDMAGVRPKLQPPNSPIRDFIVSHEKERGLNGFINLIGIESPGLTSCLSLAKMVADLIEENGS